MKERLGDKYPQWYERHRLVENQRVWRLAMEANPMRTIPEYERTLPPTYDLAEAFYHSRTCVCGSCQGPLGVAVKLVHVKKFPKEPWVRGVVNPPPALPDQILQLLQVVEEAVRSRPDPQA